LQLVKQLLEQFGRDNEIPAAEQQCARGHPARQRNRHDANAGQ
jgi:hypothetical protein